MIAHFINQHYDIAYKSVNTNIENFSNVDEFLLAEEHHSMGDSTINSLFINTFSNQDDLILVEGMPSMQPVEKDDTMQSVWLTSQAQIMGWDAEGLVEKGQSIRTFQIGILGREIHILLREFLESNLVEKEELRIKLAEAICQITDLRISISEQEWIETSEFIVETFPERVVSMESSLVKAKEISSRTFLIAGQAHLIPLNCPLIPLPLGDFPEFLYSRNAVVLIPKPEKSIEMGREKQQLMEELYAF